MYFSDGSFLFWDEFGDVGNWDFNTQNESILIYSALEVGRFFFYFHFNYCMKSFEKNLNICVGRLMVF